MSIGNNMLNDVLNTCTFLGEEEKNTVRHNFEKQSEAAQNNTFIMLQKISNLKISNSDLEYFLYKEKRWQHKTHIEYLEKNNL